MLRKCTSGTFRLYLRRHLMYDQNLASVPYKKKMQLCSIATEADCGRRLHRCPGGNVPDFGRMFLTLKYTDLTQNAYIRSWTATEIMAREKCGLLAVPRSVLFRVLLPVHCACPSLSLTAESSTFRLHYQQMSQLQWIVIHYYWIFICRVKCLEP